jgi:hydroxymethylglutaryl-CoA lyase
VSPKAIPQMVIPLLYWAIDLSQTTSKLLAIIANTRGQKWLLSMLKFNI